MLVLILPCLCSMGMVATTQKFSVVDFCKCVQEYKCTFALAAPPVLVSSPCGLMLEYHVISQCADDGTSSCLAFRPIAGAVKLARTG